MRAEALNAEGTMTEWNFGSLSKRQLCVRLYAPSAMDEWRSVGGFCFAPLNLLSARCWWRATFSRWNWSFWTTRHKGCTHRCYCETGSLFDGRLCVAGFGVTWFYSHFTGDLPCPCDVWSTEQEIKEMAKADLGGVMAISPERYGEYLDELVEQYDMPRDRVSELVAESLKELPACEDLR
jgi:hypothetical protein